MLCDSLKDLSEIDLNNYICEEKQDGERAYFSYGRLFNRRGKDITDNFPELKSNFNGIIDAEIIIVDDKLSRIERFSLIQSRTHLKDRFKIELLAKRNNVRLMVFDILEQEHINLMNRGLEQRKELLSEAMFDNPFWIKIDYETGEEKITDMIMKGKQTGQEGVILKRKNSYYEEKRSSSWIKYKYCKEAVVEFNLYETNPKGLTLCSNSHNHRVACCGQQHKEVKDLLDTKGIVMVEIEYLDMTTNGMYRMPVFKRVV